MKRFLVLCLILSLQYVSVANEVHAALSNEEVKQYIEGIGLTHEELTDYLAYHNSSLDEFETVEELESYLGTPIDANNFGQLLTVHDLTEKELHTLLAGFGESIDDYLFIEDLEVDVNFYLKHAETLHEAERLLSDIGLSEDEADRLFEHLISVNKNNTIENELSTININLEQYFSYDTATSLSDGQKNDLSALFENMLSTLRLNPSYYIVMDKTKKDISLQELLTMNVSEDMVVVVELMDEEDQVIMDMHLTEDRLNSDYLLDRGEQFLNIASSANELNVAMTGADLPNTASPYGNNIVIGLVILLIGCLLLLKGKKLKRS
ncbi:processed acidic surface protein [Litchfieldia alkalitelluris]|uniref:processed acidic surface protein n=1 Tax=Litchfieldia alkalitelluris TaxID=304268 RepID=UPI0014734D0C|nr:processed acidic surface protein [Litchfieldia alkalitelluris]